MQPLFRVSRTRSILAGRLNRNRACRITDQPCERQQGTGYAETCRQLPADRSNARALSPVENFGCAARRFARRKSQLQHTVTLGSVVVRIQKAQSEMRCCHGDRSYLAAVRWLSGAASGPRWQGTRQSRFVRCRMLHRNGIGLGRLLPLMSLADCFYFTAPHIGERRERNTFLEEPCERKDA